jgi:hypothetical protein
MLGIGDTLRELAKSGEFGVQPESLSLPITLKALDEATRTCLQRFLNFGFRRIDDGPAIVYELVDKDFGHWLISLTMEPIPGYVGNIRLSELNNSMSLVTIEIPGRFPPEIYSLGRETMKDFAIRQGEARVRVLQSYLADLANHPICLVMDYSTSNPAALEVNEAGHIKSGFEFYDIPMSANVFVRRLAAFFSDNLYTQASWVLTTLPENIVEPVKFYLPTHGTSIEAMLARGEAQLTEQGGLVLSTDPKFSGQGKPLEVKIIPNGEGKVNVELDHLGRELIDEPLYDHFIEFLNELSGKPITTKKHDGNTVAKELDHLRTLLSMNRKNFQRVKEQIAFHGGEMNASLNLRNQKDYFEGEIDKIESQIEELKKLQGQVITHHSHTSQTANEEIEMPTSDKQGNEVLTVPEWLIRLTSGGVGYSACGIHLRIPFDYLIPAVKRCLTFPSEYIDVKFDNVTEAPNVLFQISQKQLKDLGFFAFSKVTDEVTLWNISRVPKPTKVELKKWMEDVSWEWIANTDEFEVLVQKSNLKEDKISLSQKLKLAKELLYLRKQRHRFKVVQAFCRRLKDDELWRYYNSKLLTRQDDQWVWTSSRVRQSELPTAASGQAHEDKLNIDKRPTKIPPILLDREKMQSHSNHSYTPRTAEVIINALPVAKERADYDGERLTVTRLAEVAGVANETASRYLGAMKKAGYTELLGVKLPGKK